MAEGALRAREPKNGTGDKKVGGILQRRREPLGTAREGSLQARAAPRGNRPGLLARQPQKGAIDVAGVAGAQESPAQGPGAEPTLMRSLSVKPGVKKTLRAKLEGALLAAAGFCLEFFDAVVEESAEQPQSSASPAAPAYEAFGFVLQEERGRLTVSAIIGGSPADRAGLQVGDQIVTIDDGIKPTSIQHFAEAWKRGEKWSRYDLQIKRGSANLLISIFPTPQA